MKLFLLISCIANIANIASSKFIGDYNKTTVNPISNQSIQNLTYNKTTENLTNNFFSENSKQCYQCDFTINNFMEIYTSFNDHCANQIVNCYDNVCSTLLSKNQDDNNYTLKLGCVSENYCPEFIKQNTKQFDKKSTNYYDCCNSNFCNDKESVQALLPQQTLLIEPQFVINQENTTYRINDVALAAKKTKDIVSAILHDFTFENDYLKKSCISEVVFTDEDNLIITLKKNRCNNKNIDKNDIPFSVSQPINKIIFLDKNNQTIHELLSSDNSITSFQYIKDKNLLFFISENYVFIYRLDNNNQLIKINKIYFEDNPIDIAINYSSNILAIADNYKVIFYDIAQIAQTGELIPIEDTGIGEANIYRLQYAPNQDVLLVETQDENNLHATLYNVKNIDKIELIGKIPPLNKHKKLTSLSCLYQSWRYAKQTMIINRYQNINERNYYNKWIIAPSGNFMINHKASFACPAVVNNHTLLREDIYPAYHWNKNTNKYGYSVSYNNISNTDMFINSAHYEYAIEARPNWKKFLYTKSWLTFILTVHDYFFSTKKNQVLAFIATENEVYKPHRYLFLKNISYDYINEPYGAEIRKSQRSIQLESIKNPYGEQLNKHHITKHKLFSQAHSGLFNDDSSKLAIFSDKRIQIYLMNLYKKAQSEIKTTQNIKVKTKKTLEIKTTQAPKVETKKSLEIKTTQAPKVETKKALEIKTTGFNSLLPFSKKNILICNQIRDEILNNKFITGFLLGAILGSGTAVASYCAVIKMASLGKKTTKNNIRVP
jgi:hypothetical protein